MNKNSLKIISIILAISLTVSACGVASTAAPPDQIYIPTEAPVAANESPHEIYAGFTDNQVTPFIMVHQSGENLAMMGDINSSNNAGNIAGAIWNSVDGSSIVIYSGYDDGKPAVAVIGEDTIFYSNYTENTVDLTVIQADGTSSVFQAELDTDLLNKITAYAPASNSLVSYSIPNAHRQAQLDKWFWMKTGMYMLGVATCTAGGYAAITTGTVLFPPVLDKLTKACSGAILGTLIRVGTIFHMDVGGLESINSGLSMVNCASTELEACLDVFLTEAEKQEKIANQIIANPPSEPATEVPVATYTTLCGWVENNSFTGALAPTFTIWETNEVVDLGALDSSKLRQFLNAGMPGYFQVFDPAIGDDFLLDFSYAKKVNSCSQTQTQPPTQSSIISSVRGTLCGQWIRVTYENPPGFAWEFYIFVTSDNNTLTLGAASDSFPYEGYYRVYDAVIDWSSSTFANGTHVDGSITSWSGYESISSLKKCSQTPTQMPAQSSSGTQAQISNEVYYAALRQSPGYSNKNNDIDLLANVPAGDIVQILDGPEQADGLNWWHVSWNGITGWMADHTGSGKTIMIFLP